MSLIQFLNILLARRLIVLTTLLTCLVVAVVTAAVLPPRYEAKARVLMDILRPDPVTGQLVGGRDPRFYIRSQIELIRDYRVAAEVVDKLGWANNPSVIAAWQSETGGEGDIRRWGAARIIANTRAAAISGSNILEISYEAPTPEAARTIVSLLREAYIEGSLKFTTDSAGRNAEWYREQAERALAALTAAERAKSRFEQENQIVVTASGEAETAKLATLQQALLAARSNQGTQQFAAAQQATNSPVVDQLKIQLATLSDQMAQSAATLGTEHPTYKAMVSRKALLERQLQAEISAARAAGAAQSGVSRQTLAQLEAEYEAQRAKVLGMKDTLDRLGQLQREVEQRQEQYQRAAAKAAELRLQSNQSEGALLILGDAIVGTSPSFPNWPQVLLLACGLGLGLGVALALLVELLARRVRSPEDLRFASGAPVMAVIGEARKPTWRQKGRRWLSRRGMALGGLRPAE